jgi:hypothetical protein
LAIGRIEGINETLMGIKQTFFFEMQEIYD